MGWTKHKSNNVPNPYPKHLLFKGQIISKRLLVSSDSSKKSFRNYLTFRRKCPGLRWIDYLPTLLRIVIWHIFLRRKKLSEIKPPLFKQQFPSPTLLLISHLQIFKNSIYFFFIFRMNSVTKLVTILALVLMPAVLGFKLDSDCTSNGFFRNSEDCTRFYRCVDLTGKGQFRSVHVFTEQF